MQEMLIVFCKFYYQRLLAEMNGVGKWIEVVSIWLRKLIGLWWKGLIFNFLIKRFYGVNMASSSPWKGADFGLENIKAITSLQNESRLQAHWCRGKLPILSSTTRNWSAYPSRVLLCETSMAPFFFWMECNSVALSPAGNCFAAV